VLLFTNTTVPVATSTSTAPAPTYQTGVNLIVRQAPAFTRGVRPTIFPAPEVLDDMAAQELQAALQRVTGTNLDAQGAANLWAGTFNLDLLQALNVKAGNTTPETHKDLLGVLNQLAGTQGLDINGAAGGIA
jgi:hypothetical protein